MASQFVQLPKSSGGGAGVTSLNSLTGALTLVPGSNITITPSGSNITIASTGGGGGSGTVTSVATGPGLTGGTITTSGTLSVNDTLSTTQTTGFSVSNSSTVLTYLTNTSGGTFNITMAAASSFSRGRAFIFLDVGGVNEANPIVVVPNGGDTIGGLSQNKSYFTNFGALKIISDGSSNWILEPITNRITRQTFNTSGTYVAQAGITDVILRLRGGAGGGGGAESGTNGSTTSGGASGSGGAPGGSNWSIYYNFNQTPGTSYSITVGSGGTGGAGGASVSANPTLQNTNGGVSGNAGGTTSFGSIFAASGSQGGSPANENNVGNSGEIAQFFAANAANDNYIGNALIISGGSKNAAGFPGESGGTWASNYGLSTLSPEYTIGAAGSGGSVTSGSTNGGGGGGAAQNLPGDANSIDAANGGNGGLAGSAGSAGGDGGVSPAGQGGGGGAGGGGGGALAVTGTASGRGGNGADGSNGLCVIEWVE